MIALLIAKSENAINQLFNDIQTIDKNIAD